MRGRMVLLVASAAVYMLCISLPVIVVEEISGLWDRFDGALQEYITLLESTPTYNELIEWAQAWSDKLAFSYATFIFLLLAPGPLTLGISSIWLNVLRRKPATVDMVLSGFGNFVRVALMDTLRRIFMVLWAILLIVPGVVAYYRFSLAFFLLADNPSMNPFEALSLSKYYMQRNKASRFVLDLSFLGWLVVSALVFYLINGALVSFFAGQYGGWGIFEQQLVTAVVSSLIFAPVFAYRGMAAADYYHRVICHDPFEYQDRPELPGP